MHLGLVGKSLGHSFSQAYFEKKFVQLGLSGNSYQNFELEAIEKLPELLKEQVSLNGFNVTIPYKESILPFLDELSSEAREIGAVNCVKIENNRLTGHNTDVYGFSQSIKPFLDNNHERALVLGTGGASKAVAYTLRKLGVEVYFVSHREKKTTNSFLYEELNAHVLQAFKLLVNTTPLGTFPNVNECPPLPYTYFTPQHLAYDLVYNPANTLFLKKAAEKGAIVVNGLSMLQLQAEKSWEIWNQNAGKT